MDIIEITIYTNSFLIGSGLILWRIGQSPKETLLTITEVLSGISMLLAKPASMISVGIATLTWLFGEPKLAIALTATSIGMIIHWQLVRLAYHKSQVQLEVIQSEEAILSIASTGADGATSIWVKRNEADVWPPLRLEVGSGTHNKLATETTNQMLELAAQPLQNIQDWENQNELRTVLNAHGATHPIDISGSEANPKILEFFHRILTEKPIATGPIK